MIDLSRFRGITTLASWLAVIMLAWHVVLAGCFGNTPAWVLGETAVDWSYYQKFGKQIAGAARQRERSPDRFPARYGVLLGASTMQRGALPTAVESVTGMPWLLLGVGGGTQGFSKIDRSLHLLAAADLQPEVVILGVHGIWHSEPPASGEPRVHAMLEPLWYLRHQRGISNFVYAQMQRVREAAFQTLGYGLWTTFLPSTDPWHPPPESPHRVSLSASVLALHRSRNAAVGRFDSNTYRTGSPQLEVFTTVIRTLSARSARVVIALLPERSAFRSQVPEVAARLLKSAAVHAVPGNPPAVLDLRAALPNSLFYDNYHLTMDGRAKFAEILAARLQSGSNSKSPRN